jgi:hypothetical protein
MNELGLVVSELIKTKAAIDIPFPRYGAPPFFSYFQLMRSIQKILRDPALWALIAFNIFLIIQYRQNAKQYTTIIWLYWCQSVVLGIFTFIDMLTVHGTSERAKGCFPWFFLVHYGGFHFVYMIFLFADFNVTDIDGSTFKWSLLALVMSYVFYFIQNKIRYRNVQRSMAWMFFTPYLRIIPMHLTILLPKFLHWQPVLTFLVLKTIMDITGYLLTTPYYWKHDPAPEGVYI